MDPLRWLTAIPVYNEAAHIRGVLVAARRHSPDLLAVNDGSTDGSRELLDAEPNLLRVDHPVNLGYGAAVASAIRFAVAHRYDVLVTMDCDGQHQPDRIPVLLEAIHDADIVSGSRYLREFREDTVPPTDRRFINQTITREINARYGLTLTDSFCGFKAYRVDALKTLAPTESGWGMPLELWVQAARLGLRVKEIGVPRVYLDPGRSFGANLDDPAIRLAHYRQVLARAEAATPPLPAMSECGLVPECC